MTQRCRVLSFPASVPKGFWQFLKNSLLIQAETREKYVKLFTFIRTLARQFVLVAGNRLKMCRPRLP